MTLSSNQMLLQAKARQRYSDDLFGQRAILQHWNALLGPPSYVMLRLHEGLGCPLRFSRFGVSFMP